MPTHITLLCSSLNICSFLPLWLSACSLLPGKTLLSPPFPVFEISLTLPVLSLPSLGWRSNLLTCHSALYPCLLQPSSLSGNPFLEGFYLGTLIFNTALCRCLLNNMTNFKIFQWVFNKVILFHFHILRLCPIAGDKLKYYFISQSVQSLSCVWLFMTPWTAAHQASLSITDSRSLLRLMSIESVMPSNHLILCCPLFPPSILPSTRDFSNESVLCIRWPKCWSFSFSISPSNEYSELISFRTDWFDLLVVQGTLKSLLHHHSSKASILQHSAFFIVQPSHPCMTTGKTIALTRRTLFYKVIE